MVTRRMVVQGGLIAGAVGFIPASLVTPAAAQDIKTLQIFVPAAPGGGWDATGRAVELALRTDKIVENFQFEHAPRS